jgi:TusA-related sulfurtransferase
VTTVDIRGEPCGLPVVRVERVLKDGLAFSVLGDREETMDQLQLLAARHGWTCAVSKEGADWKADFKPS